MYRVLSSETNDQLVVGTRHVKSKRMLVVTTLQTQTAPESGNDAASVFQILTQPVYRFVVLAVLIGTTVPAFGVIRFYRSPPITIPCSEQKKKRKRKKKLCKINFHVK